MKLKIFFTFILSLFCISCTDRQGAGQNEISPEAYLEEALNIIETNSINKYDHDWDSLRSQAFQMAQGAETPADTYEAIRFVIEKQGDGHSIFMTPKEAGEWEDGTRGDEVNSPPNGRTIENRFGYIKVSSFIGVDDANEFATEIQDTIKEVDQSQPCAWVVDLRQNGGGNMWPMIAGLGPILGEGCFGAFIDPDGEKVEWCYAAGEALGGEQVYAKVTGTPYVISKPDAPVAVLTTGRTGSSGEAVTIAFQGRPSTHRFGFETGGYTTANDRFVLSDGAWMFLTVATFADRTGQLYGGKITPDTELVRNDTFPSEVKDWFLKQPSCSASE